MNLVSPHLYPTSGMIQLEQSQQGPFSCVLILFGEDHLYDSKLTTYLSQQILVMTGTENFNSHVMERDNVNQVEDSEKVPWH